MVELFDRSRTRIMQRSVTSLN